MRWCCGFAKTNVWLARQLHCPWPSCFRMLHICQPSAAPRAFPFSSVPLCHPCGRIWSFRHCQTSDSIEGKSTHFLAHSSSLYILLLASPEYPRRSLLRCLPLKNTEIFAHHELERFSAERREGLLCLCNPGGGVANRVLIGAAINQAKIQYGVY